MPGDCFFKIGVSVLRRADAQPYQFVGANELVETPSWQTAANHTRIDMHQRQGNCIRFQRFLDQPVFTMLTGFNGSAADNQVTVRSRRTGLAVTTTGTLPADHTVIGECIAGSPLIVNPNSTAFEATPGTLYVIRIPKQ